ncbi:MAG TPA: MBL fold metallo-hydrolase [Gemmatimonadales bacterium]|jgi:ribonuclease BN (tRNA processing enzyme)|nr:MBL fold metallo-hydrolase [Gemmatimonadales bacterium]
MSVSVTFWGTRGTIPVSGMATARYGGNTPCVSVQDAEGHRVILDAGTGIRGLGRALRESSAGRLDLLLSHVHWDHIQGLPFFPPMYADGQEIHIHGPSPAGIALETVLERQLEPAVFPVPRTARTARVTVREIPAAGTIELPGFRVRTMGLCHPGGALGYRISPTTGGADVAYLTDNELGPGGAGRVPARWRDDLTAFVRGAGLLIHDAMYSPGLAEERAGWGHSSITEAVALGAAGGVGHVVLFHHDPDHEDSQIDGLLAMARASAPAGMTVSAAHDGWTVGL